MLLFEIQVQDSATGCTFEFLVRAPDAGRARLAAMGWVKEGVRIVGVNEAIDSSR